VSEASILLVGAGGHARACIDVIEEAGRFDIAGLVGLPEQVGSRVLDYPVLGTDQDLPRLRARCAHALVTVGQIKSPAPRMHLFDLVRAAGFDMPAIISPRAHVSRHASVGPGTIVMHGAVVNAAASVGGNCIINSQSLVEHDVTVGDHCHISTGAMLNSGVSVASGSFLGSNCSVRQGVRIGERCVIGMGQHVYRDCPAGAWLPAARSGS
jgi:sugar O-acyltransferase (sialic acid O-acetyltransferase NeuD family)